MRVLVTGHRGYIGAVLCPMLLERGIDVVGLDTDLFRDGDFVSKDAPGDESAPSPTLALAPLAEVETIARDLRDIRAADLEGFDAVMHLAALSNDPLGNLDASLTTDINYTASLQVAELARAAGVERFIFSSSCSTYGAAGDDALDENAAFNPVTPYAVEKVRLERALHDLADDDFSPTYLRNATAYGASPRLRLDIVLNNLVGWAYTTGKVLMLSDGTPWRPIVHVEDICRAFLATLEAPRESVHDEAFNVGRSAHNYRIRELGEIVVDTVPGSVMEFAPNAGPDKRSYRVDFTKIETQLPGFDPQWDAKKSAERLLRCYQEFGLTKEHMEGPEFIRLARLQQRIDGGELDAQLRWLETQRAG